MASASQINRYKQSSSAKSRGGASVGLVDCLGPQSPSVAFQSDLFNLYDISFNARDSREFAIERAQRALQLKREKEKLNQKPARVIRNVKLLKKQAALKQREFGSNQHESGSNSEHEPSRSPSTILPELVVSPPVPSGLKQIDSVTESRPVAFEVFKTEPQLKAPPLRAESVLIKQREPAVKPLEQHSVGMRALLVCLFVVFLVSGVAKYELNLGALAGFKFDVTRAMPEYFHPLAAPAPESEEPSPKYVVEPAPAKRSSKASMSLGQQAVARYISKRYRVSYSQSEQIVRYAWQIGREERVEPTLILAIAGIESSYNPVAVSHVGAKGLMQVMDELHQDKFDLISPNGWSPFDPALNIRVGARIIREYTQRGGSLYEGLIWYVGAAIHRNHGGYPDKVLGLKQRIDAAYAAGKA